MKRIVVAEVLIVGAEVYVTNEGLAVKHSKQEDRRKQDIWKKCQEKLSSMEVRSKVDNRAPVTQIFHC